MSMYTPGPWKAECFLVTAENGRQVTHTGILGRRHSSYPDFNGADEDAINARLIAAAPDLLAVAKAYEAWEADLIVNGDWSGECVKMTQAQHDRMIELQTMRNAAIAKATNI